jgi:hypothetical protein
MKNPEDLFYFILKEEFYEDVNKCLNAGDRLQGSYRINE